jgi:hypothetical protein
VQAVAARGLKGAAGPLAGPEGVTKLIFSGTALERPARGGDSPVREKDRTSVANLEYHGAR